MCVCVGVCVGGCVGVCVCVCTQIEVIFKKKEFPSSIPQ